MAITLTMGPGPNPPMINLVREIYAEPQLFLLAKNSLTKGSTSLQKAETSSLDVFPALVAYRAEICYPQRAYCPNRYFTGSATLAPLII